MSALDAKTVKEAAQICGLGAPGLAGFILTPEFGPMQRFAFVLTDAELEPDPVCETSLCGAACQRACLAHLEAKGVLTRAFTNAFRP